MCGNRLQFYLGHLGMAHMKETGYFPEKRECSDKERNMAVGLCHSDKKSVCRNLQYNENVNMPDSPGWKWVQTVQTETADRYLIRLKSREEGRARKTYRVEVKEDTVDAKSAPNVTQIVLLLLLLPLLGIIFAGLRYSLTSLNPQDDLQLVLILTVIAAILGLRIWLIQRKADKTLRYFLMTRIINAPGNRNGAYAGAAQRTADQTWGRTAYAEDAAYAGDAACAGEDIAGSVEMEEPEERVWVAEWHLSEAYRRYSRLQAIPLAALALGGIIFLYAIAYRFNTSHDTARTMLLMGEAGLYMTLLALLSKVMQYRYLKKAKAQAKRYHARIARVITTGKNGATKYYLYEFMDELGRKCEARAMYPVRQANVGNVQDMVGGKADIWFDGAHLPYAFSEKDGAPDIQMKLWNLIAGTVAAVVVIALMFVYAGNHYVAYNQDADSLLISYDSQKAESDLTFEDVKDDPTVRWIIDAYAIYVPFENGEYGELGGHSREDWDQEQVKEYLSDWWGITSRATATRTISQMLKKGTRASYRHAFETYLKKGYLSMDEDGYVDIISISEIPEDEQCRTWVCYDAYGHLDTRGVDAWDYVRIMRITGLCYQCGYISLEECLDQCLPIAQRLQKEYGSFEEIFESYIYGYQFWKNDSDDDRIYFYRRAAGEAVENIQSEYNTELVKDWE